MLLGELLVQEGVLSRPQLENALRQKLQLGGRLGTNLLELGYVDVDTLARALARKLGVPPALAKHFQAVDPNVVALFSGRFAERYKAIPLGLTVNTPHRLVVAFVDPVPENIDEVAFGVGRRVEPGVAPEALVLACLERFYNVKRDPRYARSDREPRAAAIAAPPPSVAMGAGAPPPSVATPAGAPPPSLAMGGVAAPPSVAMPSPSAGAGAAIALAPASVSGVALGIAAPPPASVSGAAVASAGPESARGARAQPVLVEGELMPPAWLGKSGKRAGDGGRARMPSDAEIAAAVAGEADPVGTEVALPTAASFASVAMAPVILAAPPEASASAPDTAEPEPPPSSMVAAAIALAESAAPPPADATPAVSIARDASGATIGVLTDDVDPDIPVLEPVESAPPPRLLPSERPALAVKDAAEIIANAEHKDAIGDALVDYLRSAFGAGIVFILKDEMALGWKGFAAGADRDTVESVALPMAGPSMLKIAFDGRAAFKGAPPSDGATIHTRLWKMMKCTPPKEVLVAPIVLKNRVVNLVYAHGFGGGVVPATAVADLAAICEAAASGYARLIRTGR